MKTLIVPTVTVLIAVLVIKDLLGMVLSAQVRYSTALVRLTEDGLEMVNPVLGGGGEGLLPMHALSKVKLYLKKDGGFSPINRLINFTTYYPRHRRVF